jgi:hypothetical protein
MYKKIIILRALINLAKKVREYFFLQESFIFFRYKKARKKIKDSCKKKFRLEKESF